MHAVKKLEGVAQRRLLVFVEISSVNCVNWFCVYGIFIFVIITLMLLLIACTKFSDFSNQSHYR